METSVRPDHSEAPAPGDGAPGGATPPVGDRVEPTGRLEPADGRPGGDLAASRRRGLLLPALAVVAALAALAAFWAAAGARPFGSGSGTELRGMALSSPSAAPDFALTTHTGRPLALADLRGQAVLLFFGYTYCPDICPNTLARIAAALRDPGVDADRVTVLFVSVDPRRDTPEALARYLGNFSERVIGMRGTEEETRRVADLFHVTYSVDAPPGATADPLNYTVTHSGYVFVIDPAGLLRTAFVLPFDPADLAHDLRVILRR